MAARFARPSPTLVVASLAVLVALTGTGLAAIRVVIPAGSVGTAQLKANAVTSAKVKNGSLQPTDVKAGQVAAGPAGPAGAAGAAGAAGSQGPIGPTDAYSQSVAGPIAVPLAATTLTSLSIPQAGKYIVVAKEAFAGPGPIGCALIAGSDSDLAASITSPSGAITISNALGHEFTAAGSVDLRCAAGAGSTFATAIRITAIKVDTLTSS